MSAFFGSTKTAAYALYGDFKFKPYYDVLFHLDAISSFICHVLRAIYNLAALAFRLLITPFYIINPLAWFSLPGHLLNIVDHTAAIAVSLLTTIVHPFIVTIRTLTTLIMGYEKDTDYDQGEEQEQEDLDFAMSIL